MTLTCILRVRYRSRGAGDSPAYTQLWTQHEHTQRDIEAKLQADVRFTGALQSVETCNFKSSRYQWIYKTEIIIVTSNQKLYTRNQCYTAMTKHLLHVCKKENSETCSWIWNLQGLIEGQWLISQTSCFISGQSTTCWGGSQKSVKGARWAGLQDVLKQGFCPSGFQ